MAGEKQEKHFCIPVSGDTGSKIVSLEFPVGKIRGSLVGVFCRTHSCDRFKWSFTLFGPAV
jgi:hypothetical protein